ncbi:hypothetical protein [Pseudoxanthomonas sp.]|uniref:hypothetical protein n=1 Tax=Pseudoxanthomonas sp. TaxID=1871049 RepID=UPI0026319F3A|nr:hypothetical protein [Pseudoxanthomonas sp.]WDS36999.1 MAG: hypothetical protein O8I58_03580 [Pseudoxanthomonas sp.]
MQHSRETAADVSKPSPPARLTRLGASVLATALVVALGSLALTDAGAQIAVTNQGFVPFSGEPINYRTAPLNDPVAKLEKQLEAGKVALDYEPGHGYLRSVLKLLDIPYDSQTLVFSKTSFQYTKIAPEHPRALYYNDDVYVGAVHDGKAIELVSFDPMQGAIFYLLDEKKGERPRFERAELDCTQCHIAAGTRGVPGVLLQSVYPTRAGVLATASRTLITDQESPLSERWGGWYVSGIAQGKTIANSVVAEDVPPSDGNDASRKLTALEVSAFDPKAYLSAQSDAVAHLVLAHQTQMHNLITLTNYKTRIALYEWSKANPDGGDPTKVELPERVQAQYTKPADRLIKYLLFDNEAPLDDISAQLQDSAFARSFAAKGPWDSQRRSLRDFDLKSRIFRYPCSYLIYSEAFDEIPEPAKSYVYDRLLEILSGVDDSGDFAYLTPQERKDILQILLETKRGLPRSWQDYAVAHGLRTGHAQVAAR